MYPSLTQRAFSHPFQQLISSSRHHTQKKTAPLAFGSPPREIYVSARFRSPSRGRAESHATFLTKSLPTIYKHFFIPTPPTHNNNKNNNNETNSALRSALVWLFLFPDPRCTQTTCAPDLSSRRGTTLRHDPGCDPNSKLHKLRVNCRDG